MSNLIVIVYHYRHTYNMVVTILLVSSGVNHGDNHKKINTIIIRWHNFNVIILNIITPIIKMIITTI